ncbi:hypothetical protein CHU92_14215 [Flavobacterium cyanobacteriorum]|uniref:YtxH domain-containing protein n=1 Tax=Flavobacterium cyanobacteriorum TaxID=2022802 RepID=A0A255YST3_9FLAO|nr:hypothetical protein [Flavobacterium cyanobacteriorum]OYQ32239.1 hypothetical protein CHU92_14215 [Flavobacterium cyanobacteriorum]
MNKKIIWGIAAGAAALGIAAILINRRNSEKRFNAQAGEAKENFKKKLTELQRKAKKEYKNSRPGALEAVNRAKGRAEEWVKRANA